MIRIRSRLQESDLPFETANPIILPRKSPLVEKLIWKIHNHHFHSGINMILTEIRKRFWIIRARQTIKSLMSKCVTCKKLRGKPGQEMFAPLPKNRILISNPFENTGVDFAGPLYVLNENDEQMKSYLMLLTSFRRFISRRGVPTTLFSDNAKTFKRASLELSKLYENLHNEEVSNFSTKHRIGWKFIVERAAWWGGFWERLIKTVKDCLKFALGKSRVIDELQTILTEIEATVNARPLTYIDNDKDNLSILSPSSFLLKCERQCVLPEVQTNLKRETILQRWKERQRILSKFWKKWSTDYLQQLRTAHVNSWDPQTKMFNVGDIVLLHDQNAPLLSWKMVRINQVYPVAQPNPTPKTGAIIIPTRNSNCRPGGNG
ncbi:hypothetical protein ILUMI_03781 [Ignelater luminosus]|uniref:Integrase catalytic domain-containing protein n=1 Tax=Ignelater luminosus TaxID=2038154 RepID=A0A8K0DDV1_IGNLU|nr:hypothetical protein ILUMI_03781 [Ignelater luminosus]